MMGWLIGPAAFCFWVSQIFWRIWFLGFWVSFGLLGVLTLCYLLSGFDFKFIFALAKKSE